MTRTTRRAIILGGLSAVTALSFPCPTQGQTETEKGLQFAVLSPEDQRIVYGQRIHTPRPPASLTKLMSAALIFEAIKNPDTRFNLDTLVSIPNQTTLNGVGPGIAVFENLEKVMNRILIYRRWFVLTPQTLMTFKERK